MSEMLSHNIRKSIVEVCHWLYNRGYVVACDGNVSARTNRDSILVTPSGRCKGRIEVQELVEVDYSGRLLRGDFKPSSELPMHLMVYRSRADVKAVVHAHPPLSTAFSVAGVPLAGCILPEVVLNIGDIPLAEYATPGTEEVPASLEPHIATHNAFLLSNHGTLTLGESVDEAYYRLETVEHFARITHLARQLGGPRELSTAEARKLLSISDKLNESNITCTGCGACESYGESDGELISAIADTIALELKKHGGE
jgi:L-fuculose-phosphate aldolase